MKKIYLVPIFLLAALISFAQDFPGYRSGSNTGVNGVFFNPANIAGNGFRYDINILSVHSMVGNDKADFNLRSVGRSFSRDSLRKTLFSGESGPTTGMVNVVVNGPSFMLGLDNGWSFALTTRVRTMANIIDLDGGLAGQLIDDMNANTTLPYSIASSQNMRIAANAWNEIGLSAAREVYVTGAHRFKAGATIKLLGGMGNGYLNISSLNATIDDDILGNVYLANATGRLETGFGGINPANIEANDFFSFRNKGFGADLGVVYEFIPGSQGQYKFRAGLALLDLGSIRYKRDPNKSGAYALDITGGERFYFNELSGKDIDEYKAVLDSRPQFFTPLPSGGDNYTVSQPSSLQLDADYHITKNYFTSFSAQFPLVSSNWYNSRLYSGFTVAPRLEARMVGVGLPINYNSLTGFNAGVSFRLGPVFLGSGSVLSALFGNSKQADAHIGVRFGGKR